MVVLALLSTVLLAKLRGEAIPPIRQLGHYPDYPDVYKYQEAFSGNFPLLYEEE